MKFEVRCKYCGSMIKHLENAEYKTEITYVFLRECLSCEDMVIKLKEGWVI